MANTTGMENCLFITSVEDMNEIELSSIDSSILMSLLEDSQVEGARDDEVRLRSVIQSLEAEILNPDCFLETNSEGNVDECQFSGVEQMDSCSTLPDHLCFDGINLQFPYSSPIDNITSYFSCYFPENIENMVEFGGLRDYSQICYGMAMEEDDYSGLWQ